MTYTFLTRLRSRLLLFFPFHFPPSPFHPCILPFLTPSHPAFTSPAIFLRFLPMFYYLYPSFSSYILSFLPFAFSPSFLIFYYFYSFSNFLCSLINIFYPFMFYILTDPFLFHFPPSPFHPCSLSFLAPSLPPFLNDLSFNISTFLTNLLLFISYPLFLTHSVLLPLAFPLLSSSFITFTASSIYSIHCTLTRLCFLTKPFPFPFPPSLFHPCSLYFLPPFLPPCLHLLSFNTSVFLTNFLLFISFLLLIIHSVCLRFPTRLLRCSPLAPSLSHLQHLRLSQCTYTHLLPFYVLNPH